MPDRPHPSPLKLLVRLLAAVILAGLLVSGCGGEAADPDDTTTSSAAPDAPASDELPDDLPLPDLEPTTTMGIGDGAWGYVYTGATRKDFDAFGATLVDADFKRQTIVPADADIQTYIRDKATYIVALVEDAGPNNGMNVTIRLEP